jgi:hypothetical protein
MNDDVDQRRATTGPAHQGGACVVGVPVGLAAAATGMPSVIDHYQEDPSSAQASTRSCVRSP